MTFTKIEELKGEYLLIYFVDSNNCKQGELLCYKTEGKLPGNENLLYSELYKNNEPFEKNWFKLPEEVFV